MKICLILSCIFWCLWFPYSLQVEEINTSFDPDVGLNVMEIVQRRGYRIEAHEIETQDGYLLTLYRLPSTYKESQTPTHSSKTNVSKPVVFLLHGLLDSSFTFVCNFRDQSLAYLLADEGYDVWLGNNRGTTWSMNHLNYSILSKEYWNFSWDEMALYDLPSMLEYVLQWTSQPNLTYIGHSEGTLQAFASFSLNQTLAKKVNYMAALAPVAYIGHQHSPIFSFLIQVKMDHIFRFFGVKKFFHPSFVQKVIGKYGCHFAPKACENIVNLFNGFSSNVNASRLLVYISQTPSGTSVKNMAHFGQMARTNEFARYDYGCQCLQFPYKYFYLFSKSCPFSCENEVKYNSMKPPAYNLSRLQYPRIGLYAGKQDWLVTPQDVDKIKQQLPCETLVDEKTLPYNHLDFTWAVNAHEHLYHHLISTIKKYKTLPYNH